MNVDEWSADITARALQIANGLNGLTQEAEIMGCLESIRSLIVSALYTTIQVRSSMAADERMQQQLQSTGSDHIEQAEELLQRLRWAIPQLWEQMAAEIISEEDGVDLLSTPPIKRRRLSL